MASEHTKKNNANKNKSNVKCRAAIKQKLKLIRLMGFLQFSAAAFVFLVIFNRFLLLSNAIKMRV